MFLIVTLWLWQQDTEQQAGTPVELSENSLPNLLYKVFCHLVCNAKITSIKLKEVTDAKDNVQNR